MSSLLSLVVLLAVTLAVAADNFRIGAFNVQIFGQKKAGKLDVMNTLAKVVQRYDIVLIQEIRDIKETAINDLLKLVNAIGPASYDIVISERLGRSSSKEQYAFLYKWKAGIKILDTYQYPDPKDLFEREPFVIKFGSVHTATEEFVLAGVHIDPDMAVQEINELDNVHTSIEEYWNTTNIAIMGDFNADCSYVGKAASKKLVLRDPKYTWLIDDDVDTTTKSTDCAYDRIIMTGDGFVESVVPKSAQVYHFDKTFNLNSEQTTAVSDHYPVEFEMLRVPNAMTSSAYGIVSTCTTWIVTLLARHAEL